MSGYPATPLGEFCEIISGATPKTASEEYWGGEIPWATPRDLGSLNSKFLASTSRAITEAGLRSCATHVLPAGSVLLTSRAPIGSVAINARPMATNQGFKSLVPDTSRALPGYLYHWLRCQRSRLQSLGNGATFKELSKSATARIAVPLPPLSEQKRIEQMLDQADTIRARRRETIARLEELAQSIFSVMFGNPVQNERGWRRVPLSELVVRIDSGRSPVCLDRPARPGEWGVLKLGAVTSCVYRAGENKALPPDVAAFSACEVRPGDLLFSRKNTRELVAACALVDATPARLLLPDLIFRLVVEPRSAVDPVYLHRLLTHPEKRRKVQGLASGSSASMPNISKSRLLGLEIELPPMEVQKEFANRVRALERIKVAHQASLVEQDELVASLAHRAFRGEL
ncbi:MULTISPECIES: restriction endonuclease subunit S [Frankia]|uniref:Type I restriction modification enzyme protein S n=1 Tax=Frankia alni (strain DSM 45986 / CECT 9034 / ACN14a) TaxID=326424 RepID=Q0RKJ6_FRAAA|nr:MULTISPECIES: restriction endonuclease subunit S [Frankia]CAJ61962.1 Type I restriction modification enzyme protein S [Frankia alni ACN14a]